ncbi:uncharacterized protein KNAG_0C06450 [Huiozyma naganishii CBS 8797]|uniref:Elongation factor 1 alpha-like protein n=1 Tax=Huiozyma naganishii (strain ATCC MYA-139 / BCRC 22969 / CBS 8797 / KCTC 17520 / NBRC 10181 / NCYC 3082 / Yp74L-3) TaxID=1071383 RepID=J7RJQ1_HUIN7|nr:hypothetical protein KNAG_0C06450 [Kazachstania naganishii CBS 8797]CCK69738.1 hypothetical protein KNAG_0C06450 [Kazachstania naganishii CBS 8797]
MVPLQDEFASLHCQITNRQDEMSYSDYSDGYSDEGVQFRTEADLDAYLDDEEYDLMGAMVPRVRKLLASRAPNKQFSSFQVKQALWDSGFDVESAVIACVRPIQRLRNQHLHLHTHLHLLLPLPLPLATDSFDWLEEEDPEDEARSRSSKQAEPQRFTHKRATKPTKPRSPVDVAQYLRGMKPHLSFVVLGHVDSGKSTLMGRVLYDVGVVSQQQLHKLQRESEKIGKSSFHLAWVMDQTSEERERGVTVSICTSEFETKGGAFTIVDAPGHRDFVPNTIGGVYQSDVALLTIDCNVNGFESGFDLDGQTKEHTLLARSMDIRTVVVAMNKMDTVNWSQKRFEEIRGKLTPYFREIGFQDDQIKWVPLSGMTGEGVHKIPYPSQQYWYHGPTLIELLESLAEVPAEKNVVDAPFLFSVMESDPSSKKNDEAIITGKLESGSIQPGETINIYPSEQSALVDKIMFGKDDTVKPVAVKGEFVSLRLRQAFPKEIENGDIAAAVTVDDVQVMRTLKLRLLTFKMNRPLLPGTSVMLFHGVYEQPARISKLIALLDKADPTKVQKRKVKHLPSNQIAVVEVELTDKRQWLPVLPFDKNKHLSRIILRKDGRSIATGVVIE